MFTIHLNSKGVSIMKRGVGPVALFAALAISFLSVTRASQDGKKTADGPVEAFDYIVDEFETKGPFGSIVKVGTDNRPTEHRVRFGAAAHIGVSPDSYNKYRFALYVAAIDQSGDIINKQAYVMGKEFAKGDSYQFALFTSHENTKPGTYMVTATLAAIAKDGSVIVLDQGKTRTYTVK